MFIIGNVWTWLKQSDVGPIVKGLKHNEEYSNKDDENNSVILVKKKRESKKPCWTKDNAC